MNLRLSLAGTQALIKGHPHILAEQQLSYRALPPAGTLMKVQDGNGDFLGWAVSEGPHQAPAFRVISRERHADLGLAWWAARLERALGGRRDGLAGPGPRRLAHGEADGLPGFWVDEMEGQVFISAGSAGMAAFIEPLEAALLSLQRPHGLWRRFGQPGHWGPWHRSPLAPASPGRFTVTEGALRQAVDLDADAAVELPPWPLARRSVRRWLVDETAGRGCLLLNALPGEPELAALQGPLNQAPSGSLFKALAKLAPASQQRLLVQVPPQSKESFGRFDAVKNGGRLLAAVAAAAAPGAEILLASAHPDLNKVGPWERLWADTGLAAQPALERVLGPEPDLPELAAWPEGRAPRAFLFRWA